MVEAEIEEGQLIATLRSAGVPLLTDADDSPIVSLERLVERAVTAKTSSRIRSCLVPLFLVRPELAATVSELVDRLWAF